MLAFVADVPKSALVPEASPVVYFTAQAVANLDNLRAFCVRVSDKLNGATWEKKREALEA